ncbi:unnamed protein product [Penicillium salamii]|nr:unnamed protein product [Penicillium salamii]CAG8237423.1 unnamed protein product [Penicillium salamii]CAG8355808.1 unnamed protein product [Penicillium salamii]
MSVYITTEPANRIVDGITPDWIHPHLIQSTDPIKGRQFRVSGPIPKGACLLVDRPYAIIPVDENPDNLICSYPACNRPACNPERNPCPNACLPDVIWCSSTCRVADQVRHGVECTWLKRYAGPIRSKWSEYDFGMLWVIVRLLAMRHSQMHKLSAASGGASVQQLEHGWDGIDSLCGSSDTWSHDKVRLWSTLVKKYLRSSSAFPHDMGIDRVLHLICQEEANSFGLYPRETGHFPVPKPPVDRGEQYAAAVYPTAAIANHSCSPNIIHKADEKGRMVFTASRDIFPGEECCISYFDLTQYNDLKSRRDHLRKSFLFVCQCQRCVSEEPVEEETGWDALPMMESL